MLENSTAFVMTNLQGNLKKTLGNLYGLRTWIEYGFRQCKQELGWTDYQFKSFSHIERWWEIIFCAHTMISLSCPAFLESNKIRHSENKVQKNSCVAYCSHKQ